MPPTSEKARLHEHQQQQHQHEQQQPQESPHDSAPPGYSSIIPSLSLTSSPSSSLSFRQHALASTPGLPPLDISQYAITPGASVSKDGKTVTFSRPDLLTDGDALASFLTAQAALPPRPQIRITGINETHGDRKTDFDIRVNLLRYLLPEAAAAAPGRARASSLNYVKLVEPGEVAFRGDSAQSTLPHVNGLREWAWRFCRDPSKNKVFVLDRAVPNWNTPLLEGCIRNLLASLNYPGRISVDFPLGHGSVVITSQSPNAGVFPRLFNLFVSPKRYAVAQAVWPYANVASSPASSSGTTLAAGTEDGMGVRGQAPRVCVVQSEEEWWEVWRDAIAAAIVEGRKGLVTLDDVMERVILGKPVVKGKAGGS